MNAIAYLTNPKSSYRKVISHLQSVNPGIKILGLTATPYRLGMGSDLSIPSTRKKRASTLTRLPRFFRGLIFEYAIQYLLDEVVLAYKMVDAPMSRYPPHLKPALAGRYKEARIRLVIEKSKRATPQIIHQIVNSPKDKQGIVF